VATKPTRPATIRFAKIAKWKSHRLNLGRIYQTDMKSLHQRQLEPEVMDTVEEARDYNAMDHAAVNQAFVTDFFASGFERGDVLDLGTGTALIPIELCRRNPHCRVMAIDLAVAMLDLAQLNVEIAGLNQRIQLAQVDAKKMPFRDAMFDAVISNSIIHHLPQAESCLAEAVRVTKPGGRLFFRDLLRPESEARLEELVQTYAGQENEHSRQMFADSLRAAFTLSEVRALLAPLGFDPNSVQATSDRHWTFSAAKEIERD
jgi:ubiquinone/menaquinone biosynthesis C-methylase UbiE